MKSKIIRSGKYRDCDAQKWVYWRIYYDMYGNIIKEKKYDNKPMDNNEINPDWYWECNFCKEKHYRSSPFTYPTYCRKCGKYWRDAPIDNLDILRYMLWFSIATGLGIFIASIIIIIMEGGVW